jgi:hypothetical protein
VATAVIIGSRDNVTAKLKRKTMLFLVRTLEDDDDFVSAPI